MYNKVGFFEIFVYFQSLLRVNFKLVLVIVYIVCVAADPV